MCQKLNIDKIKKFIYESDPIGLIEESKKDFQNRFFDALGTDANAACKIIDDEIIKVENILNDIHMSNSFTNLTVDNELLATFGMAIDFRMRMEPVMKVYLEWLKNFKSGYSNMFSYDFIARLFPEKSDSNKMNDTMLSATKIANAEREKKLIGNDIPELYNVETIKATVKSWETCLNYIDELKMRQLELFGIKKEILNMSKYHVNDTVYLINDLKAPLKCTVLEIYDKQNYWDIKIALPDGSMLILTSDSVYSDYDEADSVIKKYLSKYNLVEENGLPTESGWYSIILNLGDGVCEWERSDIEYDAENNKFYSDEDGLIEDWTPNVIGWKKEE